MKKLKELFSGSAPTGNRQQMMSSCCGSGHTHQNDSSAQAKMVYQCPMKCEGGKTYDAPGNCPVCNMHLAPVGEKHSRH